VIKDIPVVALIGLPNSGKSTLLNRFTGSKKAIVAKEAHTTRDINYGQDFFEGMEIKFVDTGGLVPAPEDIIQKEVQIKSWSAISEADILVWVIDRRQHPETISQNIIEKVWKTGKPFIVAINKVDDPNQDRKIEEYAALGGNDFINFSCNTGYGLNDLMDSIITELTKLGFEQNFENEYEVFRKEKVKRSKAKEVRQNDDGSFYIVRNEDTMFEAISDESKELEIKGITSIICDLYGVLVDSDFTVNQTIARFLVSQKSQGKQIYYLSNCDSNTIAKLMETEIGCIFDGGMTSQMAGFSKPHPDIYKAFLESTEQEPSQCFYLDDNEENVIAAREIGISSEKYLPDSNPDELLAINQGKEYKTPKIIFLGKPNVGKSSMFNAMVGMQIQIVTDIAGTTMSVNDTMVTREVTDKYQIEIEQGIFKSFSFSYKKPYILLDSVGIRKPGQRTFGPENFGTFRTIQSVHEADIVCLVIDGSLSISHQDQVIAGIAKEAKKGLVVIINKADLVPIPERKSYIKQLESRFKFLKVDRYLWISAKEAGNFENEETKHLIFDFDGVIGDTEKAVIKSLQEKHNLSSADAKKWNINYFSSTQHSSRDEVDEDNVKQSYQQRHNILIKHIASEGGLFDKFLDNILQIPDTRLAIVTSNYKSVVKDLLGEKAKKFDLILDLDDSLSKEVKIAKVCKKWKVDRSKVYYFTDTISDVIELREYMDARKIVGCSWGFLGKKLLLTVLPNKQILNDFDDINGYFDRENDIEEDADLNKIWQAIDLALITRSAQIPREQLRKLFNFIVKKKPPQKLRTKKKAILYDLIQVRTEPPTFHLLVKDKRTVHWSFIRFLENLLRQNFNLINTEIMIKLIEPEEKKKMF
jgi:small GTP-binding protein